LNHLLVRWLFSPLTQSPSMLSATSSLPKFSSLADKKSNFNYLRSDLSFFQETSPLTQIALLLGFRPVSI
jgi:hypothetical protein